MTIAARVAARYRVARGVLDPAIQALKAGNINPAVVQQALDELEVKRTGNQWLVDGDWMNALGPRHKQRAMTVVKSLARLVRDPDSAAEVPAGTLAFELNWLQGLINKADKKTFQHGAYEIVPHGVTGPKVRECLEALDKAHKAIHRKFPQVLYGRVFIVKNLSGHSSAASYVENGDVVYLSLKAKGSVGDVYALCHEFGHRFFYKFWKDKTQRDEFMRLSTTTEYREVTIDAAAREQIADEYVLIALARRDDATQPTPSELFLTWLTHVAGTPIGRSTQKLGVRFVKGEDVEAELRRAILAEKDFTIRTKELLREPEYVTPYGKRGGWAENFAEAFAHHVLGMTLPPGIGAIMGSL